MSEISGRELLVAPPGKKGDRGHSIVGFEQTARDKVVFLTEEPLQLGPVELPIGPAGQPSMTRLRLAEEYLGLVVTFWAATEPAELVIYGDTGVWETASGTQVRRYGQTVEAHGPLTDLPVGFRPAIAQEAETDGATLFTTRDEWPKGATLEGGTLVADPTPIDALGGYEAAIANGYVGTAEEWNESLYMAGIPKGGNPGQYLQRTSFGAAWADLPRIGGEPWRDIILNGSWGRVRDLPCQARFNNGTVEVRGWLEYKGPNAEAGTLRDKAIEIGQLPGDLSPLANIEDTRTAYRGDNYQPQAVRINYGIDGSIALMCYQDRFDSSRGISSTFPARRDTVRNVAITTVNISGGSWATTAPTR